MKNFILNILTLPWDIFCIIYKDDADRRNDEKKQFKNGMNDCLNWEPHWFPEIRIRKILRTDDTKPLWDRSWWPSDKEIDHYFKHKKLK